MQILACGQAFVERVCLCEHTRLLADLQTMVGGIHAQHTDLPCGGPVEPVEQADGGGLACAVGTKQRENLTRFYFIRDVSQSIAITKAMTERNYLDRIFHFLSSRCFT